jgi:signal transduction histidine kinase
MLAIRAETKRDAAELAIIDTGSGLSPAARERLFEPFFTTKRGGLGLGLAVSRSLVEAHHGQLTLSPRLDGRSGAVARLTLPLHRAGRGTLGRAVRPPRAPVKRKQR